MCAPLRLASISACCLPARDLASSAARSHRCPPRAPLMRPERQRSTVLVTEEDSLASHRLNQDDDQGPNIRREP